MPYETTCPTCSVHLTVGDDVSASALLCPRCLHEVPQPSATATVRAPAATETRLQSRINAPRRAPVPSVAAEAKSSSWAAYFAILLLGLFTSIGVYEAWDSVPLRILAVALGLAVITLVLHGLIRFGFGRPAPSATRLLVRLTWVTASFAIAAGLALLLMLLAFVILVIVVCGPFMGGK